MFPMVQSLYTRDLWCDSMHIRVAYRQVSFHTKTSTFLPLRFNGINRELFLYTLSNFKGGTYLTWEPTWYRTYAAVAILRKANLHVARIYPSHIMHGLLHCNSHVLPPPGAWLIHLLICFERTLYIRLLNLSSSVICTLLSVEVSLHQLFVQAPLIKYCPLFSRYHDNAFQH